MPAPRVGSDTGVPTFVSKHVTPQNVLLVVVALFNLGTFYQRQQSSNEVLREQMVVVREDVRGLRTELQQFQQSTEKTYVRKDGEPNQTVLVRLAQIDGRLQAMEALIRAAIK